MSKYRYWWRPNVERILRAYPYLKLIEEEGHKQKLTAAYSVLPRAGGRNRGTEEAALKRPLNGKEEEAVRAVEKAMEDIRRCRDGEVVLKIVEMVDFKRSHTIEGAAMVLHMHRNRIADKRTRFINLVGEKLGWL